VYLALALAACDKSPIVDKRTIVLHVPKACAIDGPAYGTYYARGDFLPTQSDPAEDTVLLAQGVGLGHLPPYARAIFVNVIPTTQADDRQWNGVGLVPPSGDLDVLLWPDHASCGLSATIPFVENPALGIIDARHALVVGGGLTLADNRFPQSFVIDLGTGRVTAMPHGPLTSRARATVTPFGAGAIVAGGVRSDDNTPLDTFEVWDPSTGDFDGNRLPLTRERADHGAIALVTGETLLVGGTGKDGMPIGSTELITLDRRAQAIGTVYKRKLPSVMRLASGEILIAGGFDEASRPVGHIEILSADARTRLVDKDFLAAAIESQAFVPLSGGGALAIVIPSGPTTLSNVWRISADGSPVQLPPITDSLTDVRLFQTACGGALLWTGSTWKIFDPWDDRFHPVDASSTGPAGGPAFAGLSSLALWLAREDLELRVVGRLFSVRNEFSSEIDPVKASGLCTLAAGAPLLHPLAPDRSPSAGLSIANGEVALAEGTSAFVTDATYLDFALDLDLISGQSPIVVLRSPTATFSIGGADCALSASAPAKLHVERTGAGVRVRVGDGQAEWCNHAAPTGRVSVGFLGRGSSFRNIRIERRWPLPFGAGFDLGR
jgi:hypothetical protein